MRKLAVTCLITACATTSAYADTNAPYKAVPSVTHQAQLVSLAAKTQFSAHTFRVSQTTEVEINHPAQLTEQAKKTTWVPATYSVEYDVLTQPRSHQAQLIDFSAGVSWIDLRTEKKLF